MAISNPCSTLNTVLGGKVTLLESLQSDISSQVTTVKGIMDDYAGGATDPASLLTILTDLTSSTIGYGSLNNYISLFTGSCLNNALSELRGAMGDMDSIIGNAFNDIGSLSGLVEKSVIQAIQGLVNALGLLGIPNILEGMDSMLGCLADSGIAECISSADSINSRINAVNSALYLNSSGNFDLPTMMDASSLASAVKTNLTTINTTIESVKAEAITNIQTVAETSIVPSSYF